MTTKQAYDGFELQPIAGQWRRGSSSQQLTDTNPYSGDVLLQLQLASRDDVDAAYAAAAAAQTEWAARLPEERAVVLHRAVEIMLARAEEIQDWIVRESGSSRLKAIIEWDSARRITQESATFCNRVEGRILASAIPNQESRVYRAPLGVVGVISPWNFPYHLTARSVAPALALGNAVVVKPASDTPVTGGLLLAKIYEEAGLPAGLFSVVAGAGSEIGDHFVAHPVPSLISFTGSTEVGRNVGRIATGGQHIKRVALELGGNAPLVVLDDADIEQAAQAAVVGRFLHQGQICMSTNRVIVDARVHDAFVAALKARVEQLPYGDPADAANIVGPLINGKQLDSVLTKIEQAKKDGATLLVGGAPQGNVLPPHLFVDVDPSWSIAVDETFGPVLPVIKARDEAHALALANASEYGLSAAVFTRDYARGLHFARGIRSGMCHINDITVDDQTNAPFGGEKNSGLGRFNGEWAIEEFTRAQWVTLQFQPRPYPF
ncbi:aldehyde dehydrogenase family protein [Vogesella indigofera]|uniref:Aldehyde dehydrogenase family protein n=1 Tax=Vogesella indigofera TaxID=45465 RepID=A0ABT5I3X4_VOGIN|nr:aldehyde dehydrogenase family protein [Vogesella indigofera]MDC7690809.1 aldehyde dehydrogenase family protein [Vogesella indigofera]